jgi:hypothetical protein
MRCFIHDKRKAMDLAYKEGKAGATLKFQDGTLHGLTANGTQVRLGSRKLSKAERKAAKRERVANRQIAREQAGLTMAQMA